MISDVACWPASPPSFSRHGIFLSAYLFEFLPGAPDVLHDTPYPVKRLHLRPEVVVKETHLAPVARLFRTSFFSETFAQDVYRIISGVSAFANESINPQEA